MTKFIVFVFSVLIASCTVSTTSGNDSDWPLDDEWPFDCTREETPFIGINLDPWRFIVQAGEVYSREDFAEMLQTAKSAAGATHVRIHLNGGAFEPTVGTYSEEAFRQLDAFLAAAEETDLLVLFSLRDYLWGPWPPVAYDPYWTIGSDWEPLGYENLYPETVPSDPAPNRHAIINNDDAKSAYKDFISYVLNRENTVTGEVYKNDPTIWAWEIINEPSVMPGEFGPWLDEMCAYLESLDPGRPIGLSLPGVETEWWEPEDLKWTEFDTPELDFIALHYYEPAEAYSKPGSWTYNANLDRFRNRVESAQALGKDVYLTEFGVLGSEDAGDRAHMYSALMGAAADAGVLGVFPYSWGPDGPNGWGGDGGFCIYRDNADLCYLMKTMAENP